MTSAIPCASRCRFPKSCGRVSATPGLLGFAALLVMVPLALVLGVLAGMREGSKLDRTISIFSILTTSVPEFASAVFLSALFVFWLGLLPGTSTMTDGFSIIELILPALVLVIFGFGYIARMTRASMAEVMTTHYVRTAVLKGLPYQRVIVRHRAPQRAHHPVHRDHALHPLHAHGADRRGGVLRLQRLRRAAFSRPLSTRTSTSSKPVR